MSELSASEAIYAFAGWLSSREEGVLVGAAHDCSPLAKAVEDFCQEKGLAEPRPGWHLAQTPEPECVRGKPNGFYLLSGGEGACESCLVQLYTPSGAACRHLGWGVWDGAAVMPVHDLSKESALTPVRIFTCAASTHPTDDLDVDVEPLGDAYHSIDELYLHRHRLFIDLWEEAAPPWVAASCRRGCPGTGTRQMMCSSGCSCWRVTKRSGEPGWSAAEAAP